MKLSLVIALCLTALVVIFSVQNSQPVQVTFIKWYFEGSLVVVLLLTFMAGVAAAYLASLPGRIRKGRELATSRKRVQELEKDGGRKEGT